MCCYKQSLKKSECVICWQGSTGRKLEKWVQLCIGSRFDLKNTFLTIDSITNDSNVLGQVRWNIVGSYKDYMISSEGQEASE